MTGTPTDLFSASDPVPPAHELTQVLHGAPAAVLVIDLRAGAVVHANPAAVALTGEHVRLPVDLDTWSEAAGLTDLAGRPLRTTGGPLSLVATGRSVSGEPVVARDAARRRSSAATAQNRRAEGKLLWVTGFPLSEGTDDNRALVVFLHQPGRGDQGERQMEMLRDRAVIATDLSFTVTDPSAEDNPLVWVNPAFSRLTGYGFEESVGRNCRFLQGPNTDPAAVERIRTALQARTGITEVLLNYRKDGTAFWNEIAISPVLDAHGELVNFVGVQSDVTERILVEQDRRVALASAEEARNDLRMLTDATTWMSAALDVSDVAGRLARSVVPALADTCCVDLFDEPHSGRSRRVVAIHRDPDKTGLLYRAAGRLHVRLDGPDPFQQAVRTGEAVLLADMPESLTAAAGADDGMEDLYRQLSPRSAILVPLRARGQLLGMAILTTENPYGHRYTQRDLSLAADLANRAALALDNARLYAREHAAAQTLQLSLLPDLPEVPGLQAAAVYLPGADGNRVGGDWYDLVDLPDGAVALAVGDVVGHDLTAAAAMGQLRGVLRSYAWEGLAPGAVLDRCDQLVQGLAMAAMASALYARLEPGQDGARRFYYSNAGHPPPLLRLPDGTTRFLEDDLSPMLGAAPDVVRSQAGADCPPGSLLLLYTDGLIDLPGEDADERHERLRRLLYEAPADIGVQDLCDRVVEILAPPEFRTDDIALLAVRVGN